MSRRCARCSEKTSEAQFKEICRDLGHDREGLFAATCLPPGGHRPACPSLPLQPPGRRRPAKPVARAVVRTTPVRLSPPAHPAGAGGLGSELEEALPDLPGGAADSAQAWRPQAGAWNPCTDGDPPRTKPALVAGLRGRQPRLGPPVPGSVHHRRLQPGVPGRRR